MVQLEEIVLRGQRGELITYKVLRRKKGAILIGLEAQSWRSQAVGRNSKCIKKMNEREGTANARLGESFFFTYFRSHADSVFDQAMHTLAPTPKRCVGGYAPIKVSSPCSFGSYHFSRTNIPSPQVRPCENCLAGYSHQGSF